MATSLVGVLRRRLYLPLFVALGLVAVACGDATNEAQPTSTSTSTATAPPARSTVRAYFLRDAKVGPVTRNVTGVATASAALDALLAGTTAPERALGLSSTVPAAPSGSTSPRRRTAGRSTWSSSPSASRADLRSAYRRFPPQG